MFSKYRELGLALIPIKEGTKRPDVGDEWQKYCDRLPTEEECDFWEAHKGPRYGVTLGRASRIMAVDIDSDDPKIIAAVKLSPVIKRGRKGETRFFRYDPEVQSCKVAGIIDILSHGRQTLLPPTIHPETEKPYHWITLDTLENFSIDELPTFTAQDLAELRSALEPQSYDAPAFAAVPLTGGPWFNDDPKRLCPHGSHDRLKAIANAMIGRGVSPDEAVKELLRYDEENHKPVTYFADHTRADCVADPVTNALFFYASNAKTFNRRQIQSGLIPSVPTISGSELIDISAVSLPPREAWKPMPWPEPKGVLKELRDLILESSKREQNGLAMGGAIAIASAAIGNKLKFGRTWPNVYILNVANTGAGKSFPFDAATRVLSSDNGFDLIGSGGFRSSSAILKDLTVKRTRLDLVDECSGMFKAIRDGGIFQSDMMDIMNALWSASTGLFLGPESIGRERVQVWNPSVSILFATTPDGLKNSISRDFVTQGFIPRCLIFHDPEYGRMKQMHWNQGLEDKIAARLSDIYLNMGQGDEKGKKNLMSPKGTPDEMKVSDAALKMLDDHSSDCADRLADKNCDEVQRHFLSRANQQAAKLALIHGAMHNMTVGIDDVMWGINTLEATWYNASPLLPQIGAENVQESNVMRVLEVIRKSGSIHHSDLIGKTRHLKTNERTEILSSLESEGRVLIGAEKTATKSIRVYQFVR